MLPARAVSIYIRTVFVGELNSKYNRNQFGNIPFEIIWFNPRLKTNNELSHQKSFHRTGLSLIIDLFNSDGEFHSQETITNFNVNIIFSDYAGLKKKCFSELNSVI